MRDQQGFVEFVRASQADLMRYGLMLTGGSLQAAEDLAQDALIEVGRRWPRVRQMDHPAAYCKRTMARAHFRDEARRKKQRVRSEAVATGGEARMVESPVHGALWQAIVALPPKQRTVIFLRYFGDMSEAQVADFLGCSRGTVKSQASRGISTIRATLTAGAGTKREEL